jgi:hypothetical protein
MATAVTFARRLLVAMMALVLSLAIVALRPALAQAQTVVSVINLPDVVIDNQCNGEPVALSGDLLTVVTTRPTPNGGATVRSVSVTKGLQGTGLVSGVSYRAVELSGTVVNQLPPPGTGTFFSTVTTLLIPQGSAAPSMLLVVVVKGTLAPDGTISNEVVQTYLVCRPRGTGRLVAPGRGSGSRPALQAGCGRALLGGPRGRHAGGRCGSSITTRRAGAGGVGASEGLGGLLE